MNERFAAIDIGSNGVRLLFIEIYHYNNEPVFKKLELIRLPIRLGDDVFNYGKISETKFRKLRSMALSFKSLMHVFDITNYKACATSAMRDAENGSVIINHIFEETGIKIDIIEGEEEASILFDAIFETPIDKNQSYLFVDVGGGSTEVTFLEKGKRKEWRSFNMGTVRLKEGKQDEKVLKEMKSWIEEHCPKYNPEIAIGTGGNINRLYKMSDQKNYSLLSRKELKETLEELEKYTIDELKNKIGLKPHRADVIIPGGYIYHNVMKFANIKNIFVPKVGLADGIIIRMYKEALKQK